MGLISIIEKKQIIFKIFDSIFGFFQFFYTFLFFETRIVPDHEIKGKWIQSNTDNLL
jgi:hypothetical protein